MNLKNLLPIFFFCLSIQVFGQTLGKQSYVTGFSSPVDIANAGDGSNRLFIVEKTGRIKIILPNKTVLSTPFLNISHKINSGGERGLLGLAFHPDFENNGFLYVNYVTKSVDTTIIARYTVSASNPNIVDTTTLKILLKIKQPYSNHNGGCLKFSPNDGYLYIAMGDGGDGGDPQCYAQNPASLLGKMLRLDVDQNVNTSPYYGIPATNPFVGNAAYLPEIWAVGLRNPWRFSFDRSNGDLWIADVGQGFWEEVDHLVGGSPSGVNFGWRVHEGNACYNDPTELSDNCIDGLPACGNALYKMPVFQYGHNNTNGGFSITGGFVYRGCDFPNLKGKYICGDYSSGNAWAITSTYTNVRTNGVLGGVSAFGEDENGELYSSSLDDNRIYRIIDPSVVLSASVSGAIPATQFALDTFKITAPISVTGGVLNVTSKNLVVASNVNVNNTLQINLIKPGCP
ncbi:MAG TPA: PQQ-dependent sugar dehydrogenase [Saprospiraceae bacterium]|nr:PQQ-dependent sugar dehydrogenase [Saprospiraceae bacterium]